MLTVCKKNEFWHFLRIFKQGLEQTRFVINPQLPRKLHLAWRLVTQRYSLITESANGHPRGRGINTGNCTRPILQITCLRLTAHLWAQWHCHTLIDHFVLGLGVFWVIRDRGAYSGVHSKPVQLYPNLHSGGPIWGLLDRNYLTVKWLQGGHLLTSWPCDPREGRQLWEWVNGLTNNYLINHVRLMRPL